MSTLQRKVRSRREIESRRDLVACSPEMRITLAYDEAEAATRGMSPSAAYSLALQIASNLGQSGAIAVAKAVRWQRVLDRDYPE